jgi:hypothetical protein
MLNNSAEKTGGEVMKKILTVTAMSVGIMLLVLPLGYAQEKGAPPSQSERTFEGQLSKVDADARAITVKGATAEMVFAYSDATQIVGADGKVQGLASRTGTALKVTYREADGKRTATRIEIMEKR